MTVHTVAATNVAAAALRLATHPFLGIAVPETPDEDERAEKDALLQIIEERRWHDLIPGPLDSVYGQSWLMVGLEFLSINESVEDSFRAFMACLAASIATEESFADPEERLEMIRTVVSLSEPGHLYESRDKVPEDIVERICHYVVACALRDSENFELQVVTTGEQLSE